MARAIGGRKGLRKVQDFLAQQTAATGGRVRTTPALEAYLTAELEAEKSLSLQQEALTEQKRATAKREGLQAEQLSEQAKAAEVQGYIQAAEVTAIGSLALKELGLVGGGEVAAGATTASTASAATAPELISLGGVTGEAAGGVGVGTEVAGATGGASTAAGGTATGESASAGGGGGVGLGIAAVVIADAYVAESAAGGFATWEERQMTNLRGFEFGGISPGAAATLERWGVKSPAQISEEALGIDSIYGDINQQITEAVGTDFLNDVNTFFAETFGL